MEKLFDETYGEPGDYSRTVWYGYADFDFSPEQGALFASLVKADLAAPTEPLAGVSHWVFYSGKPARDAIDAAVRSSFMVRERDGNFACHYNMTDYEFVMSYDETCRFCVMVEGLLKGY